MRLSFIKRLFLVVLFTLTVSASADTVFKVTSPYPDFMELNGSPLNNGFIYIGVKDKNPETNPIAVFWDKEKTMPATQPIRTINGYPSKNGVPANIFIEAEYSITVRDKKNQLVIYSEHGQSFSGATIKQLYENNADTNTFTDANKILLESLITIKPEVEKILLSKRMSIFDAGILNGDGSGDASAALQALVDAMSKQENVFYNSPANSYSIYFPSLPRLSHYMFDTMVTIPPDVNVKLYGEAFGGAVFEAAGNQDYLLYHSSGNGAGDMFEVENLTFIKAGIKIQGAHRVYTKIHNNNFIDTKKEAIIFDAKLSGATTGANRIGPVRTIVVENDFYRCNIGVAHLADTYLVGRIENNYFKNMHGVSILIDSAGIHVAENQFEGMIDTAATNYPHIWLRGAQPGGISHTLIKENTFGGEVITSNQVVSTNGNHTTSGELYNVPKHAIIVGQEILSTNASSSHFGLRIRDNIFNGSIKYDGVTKLKEDIMRVDNTISLGIDHAVSAVKFYQSANGDYFSGNYIARAYDHAIEEHATQAVSSRSVMMANTLQNTDVKMFSDNGLGWVDIYGEHSQLSRSGKQTQLKIRDKIGTDWLLSVSTTGAPFAIAK